MTKLGQRILEYRAANHISQREMAQLLGTYINMIWRLESGKRPHKATEYRLAAKLDELERSEGNV